MHTISSFLYPPISLHPSIFPLIPPPPPLLHLEGFPFLCFSSLLTRESRRKIFSLFPFPVPSFSYYPPPFCLPPPPSSSPSLLTLFLSSFLPSSPSFKICESYSLPPCFIVSYSLLFPFPFVYLSSVSPPPPPLSFPHPHQKKNLQNKLKI